VDYDRFARDQLPGLARFAAALTGDRQLAQDLVQDTLVRAYVKWARVAATERPELYLRRMLLNAYLSWRRRWYQRTVRPVADPSPADGRQPFTEDPAGRIVDRDQLATLLAGLGRQQRAAIVLRFYEDRSDAEIGQVLGCAPATVRSHISRGLATLRLRVRADEDTEPPPTTATGGGTAGNRTPGNGTASNGGGGHRAVGNAVGNRTAEIGAAENRTVGTTAVGSGRPADHPGTETHDEHQRRVGRATAGDGAGCGGSGGHRTAGTGSSAAAEACAS
jgi:RNA polymerase sigma-70 factor (sigma-E family)